MTNRLASPRFSGQKIARGVTSNDRASSPWHAGTLDYATRSHTSVAPSTRIHEGLNPRFQTNYEQSVWLIRTVITIDGLEAARARALGTKWTATSVRRQGLAWSSICHATTRKRPPPTGILAIWSIP